jgi:histone demethylase JARID1
MPASPQAPQKQRPFGLQDCPAFYPTLEEFKDPMNYIRAISPQAQEFGIAKIVPPETWRMPFVTDTEVSEIFIYLSFVMVVPKGGRARSL